MLTLEGLAYVVGITRVLPRAQVVTVASGAPMMVSKRINRLGDFDGETLPGILLDYLQLHTGKPQQRVHILWQPLGC